MRVLATILLISALSAAPAVGQDRPRVGVAYLVARVGVAQGGEEVERALAGLGKKSVAPLLECIQETNGAQDQEKAESRAGGTSEGRWARPPRVRLR